MTDKTISPLRRRMTEDLRRYQLQMRSRGASATSMNAAVSALRFFFGVTLGRKDANDAMITVREPRKLPVILSPEEVARLLDAAPGLKYRAALSVAYGAGLRAAEVVSLKVSDIDSERMARFSNTLGSSRARAARTTTRCCPATERCGADDPLFNQIAL